MGHAGHLIVSDKCRFHLATYVGKYVVSTVGEYWPEREIREIHAQVHDLKWLEKNKHLLGDYFDSAYFKRFGFQCLGAGDESIYETMVFKAKRSKDKCCPYVQISGRDVEMKRYATAEEAHKGHLKMCEKWKKK